MRRVLKWIGVVLGAIVGLVLIVAAILYVRTGMRLNKVYDIQPAAVVVPTDAASIERGAHLAAIFCAGCHGEDFSGTAFFEDESLGSIPAPNLTPGTGGADSEFTDADWVLAIRHGLEPDGTPLLVMPSASLYYLSDTDLGALIAFLKSLPPVDKEWDERQLTPLARILVAVGAMGDAISAETIDHTGPRPVAPAAGVTVDYGEYLATTGGCRDCHGAGLTGGKSPDPAAPPAPDITPGGALKTWTQADFVTAVHTRKSEFMPWEDLNHMTNDELSALWLYLQSFAPEK